MSNVKVARKGVVVVQKGPVKDRKEVQETKITSEEKHAGRVWAQDATVGNTSRGHYTCLQEGLQPIVT